MFLDADVPDGAEPHFDWDVNVDDLSKFRVVVFSNQYVDVKMVELANEQEIFDYVNSFFQEPLLVTQMIIPNPKSNPSMTPCSHFRLIAEDFHSKSSTNYKLESFFNQAGITGVHSRCSRAMVIGMAGNMSSVMVSVPSQFWSVSLPEVKMCIPSADTTEVCDIPGMCLPINYLPSELHWQILKYCQHPCASILREDIDRINEYWSNHFDWMFFRCSFP